MLLKLSDKVLLNFFILPIFSTGCEAGIRSHIAFDSGDFFPAAVSERCLKKEHRRLLQLKLSDCNCKHGKPSSHFSSTKKKKKPCGDFGKDCHYISKKTQKQNAAQDASGLEPCVIWSCVSLRSSCDFFLSFFPPFFPQRPSRSLAPPQSRCHFWDSLSPVSTPHCPAFRTQGLVQFRGAPLGYWTVEKTVLKQAPPSNVLQEERIPLVRRACCLSWSLLPSVRPTRWYFPTSATFPSNMTREKTLYNTQGQFILWENPSKSHWVYIIYSYYIYGHHIQCSLCGKCI